MRYRITITTPHKKSAEAIWEILNKHELYAKNKEPVSLSPVTELCDECIRRGC